MGKPVTRNNNPVGKGGCTTISSKCDEKRLYKIYSLCEPITNEVRYIGLTRRELEDRLKGHLTCDCKAYKGNWILSLKQNGFKPTIKLIENNLTKEEAIKKEKEYIALYKKNGAKLTNLTDGGEGTFGYIKTEEERKKLSERQTLHNSFKDKKHTKESKQKISLAISGEKNGFYGKTHTEDTRKIIKEKREHQIMKSGWNHNDETKKKIGDINRGRKKTPEEIEKIRKALKGRVVSEEHKMKLRLAWVRIKNNKLIQNETSYTE